MKKLVTILLVAMLIVTSLVTVAYAAGSATVSASNVETTAGKTVTVDVTVSGGNFSTYEFYVEYDAKLTLGEITDPSTGLFQYNIGYAPNTIKAVFAYRENLTSSTFSIDFIVPADAQPGDTYVVSVSAGTNGYVSDDQLKDLTVTYSAGQIKIHDCNDYKEEHFAKPADCDNAGNKYYWKCTSCGTLYDENGNKLSAIPTIPATGHSWGKWNVITPADCENDGEKQRECKHGCGEVETKTIPALGHDWTEWTVTKEATCTTDGEKQRKCNNCGEVETKVIPSEEGHKWGEWEVVKEATCTTEGKKQRECTSCGMTITKVIDALGHSWSKWTVVEEATCTEEGKEERVCNRCGEKETRTIDAIGHDISTEWEYDADSHWHTCSRCVEKFDCDDHDLTTHKTDKGQTYKKCTVCPYQSDPEGDILDDVPNTGVSTGMITMIVLGLFALVCTAAYTFKRIRVR